jgi:hypothetical protein
VAVNGGEAGSVVTDDRALALHHRERERERDEWGSKMMGEAWLVAHRADERRRRAANFWARGGALRVGVLWLEAEAREGTMGAASEMRRQMAWG